MSVGDPQLSEVVSDNFRGDNITEFKLLVD